PGPNAALAEPDGVRGQSRMGAAASHLPPDADRKLRIGVADRLLRTTRRSALSLPAAFDPQSVPVAPCRRRASRHHQRRDERQCRRGDESADGALPENRRCDPARRGDFPGTAQGAKLSGDGGITRRKIYAETSTLPPMPSATLAKDEAPWLPVPSSVWTSDFSASAFDFIMSVAICVCVLPA